MAWWALTRRLGALLHTPGAREIPLVRTPQPPHRGEERRRASFTAPLSTPQRQNSRKPSRAGRGTHPSEADRERRHTLTQRDRAHGKQRAGSGTTTQKRAPLGGQPGTLQEHREDGERGTRTCPVGKGTQRSRSANPSPVRRGGPKRTRVSRDRAAGHLTRHTDPTNHSDKCAGQGR